MLSAMLGDLVLKPLSRGDLRASTRSLSFLWSCEPCILSTPNPMRECLFPILPGTCCCRGEVGTAVLCAVCCVLCAVLSAMQRTLSYAPEGRAWEKRPSSLCLQHPSSVCHH